MKHKTTLESSPMPTPAGSIDRATLELLAKWKAEDSTKDPEAIRSAEREVAEFKKAMNESRSDSGEHPLFS